MEDTRDLGTYGRAAPGRRLDACVIAVLFCLVRFLFLNRDFWVRNKVQALTVVSCWSLDFEIGINKKYIVDYQLRQLFEFRAL